MVFFVNIKKKLPDQVVELHLGAGGDRLGGACDHYEDDLYLSDSYGEFCDGPLRPKTSYRWRDWTQTAAVMRTAVSDPCLCVRVHRLSVRAFTKLFDENHREVGEPLFSDTYLCTPLKTHAGERKTCRPVTFDPPEKVPVRWSNACSPSEPLGGVVEGLSAGMFLIGMMVAVVSLLVYRQRLRKVWGLSKTTNWRTSSFRANSKQLTKRLKSLTPTGNGLKPRLPQFETF